MLDRVREFDPLPCQHCGEPVLLGEPFVPDDGRGLVWHVECFARTALGSLAHVERRCSCYVDGSTEGDPPGMTKRQAAVAAYEAARKGHR